MDAIQRPFGTNIPAFIANNDFSYTQAWVEGSLENADELLSKYF